MATAWISSIKSLANVPVLAMTASTDADLARHLQALGARYVIKPLAARDLLDLVNTSLKKGAAHDQSDRSSSSMMKPAVRDIVQQTLTLEGLCRGRSGQRRGGRASHGSSTRRR